MGKRLRKQELLDEIRRERTALDETLAHLSVRQMTKTGVTRGGWSVKDVLAHLVEWQQMNLDWYAAGLRGETPAMPAPGYTLRELPRLNQAIYREHHRRSLQAVLRDYQSLHERVVALIETLPDADLVTLNRFSWTGPSWTLSDYLRAATAAHYLWARTRIRRWWRSAAQGGGVARGLRLLLNLLLPAVVASAALAQPAPPQDSTLNNLVHAKDYVTAPAGALGAVIERGRGPVDMVLVSGFGLGASTFDGFMRRNAKRYHMLAVTLPGFEGTSAPPMPAPGVSYGDQTWTRSAVAAVVALVRERKLARVVVVGHFINGTQVAMRLALDHPEFVSAVVLLAGTPRFEPVTASSYWAKNLTLEQKVRAVDQFTAPRWFRTVTRETWVKGNLVATDYSADSALGGRFADLANRAPLPMLVRYLCEYHASDLWPELERLSQPLLLIQPSFTARVRADTTRRHLQDFFASRGGAGSTRGHERRSCKWRTPASW